MSRASNDSNPGQRTVLTHAHAPTQEFPKKLVMPGSLMRLY